MTASPPQSRRRRLIVNADDFGQSEGINDGVIDCHENRKRAPENENTVPPPSLKRNRVLIFVVAYCAESTLKSVLERIPLVVFERYDCEILVVDDASEDRTFAIGREYQLAHPEIP